MHVHLGLYGRFDVHRDATEVPAPVGQVRLRLVRPTPRAEARVVRRPPRRHRLRAADPPSSARRWSPGSAPTRCGPTPIRTWPGQRIRRSRAPIAGLLMDQARRRRHRERLPRRAALPAPRRPVPPRQHACGSGRWRAMWDDLVALMAEGVRTGRIDTVRPEHLTDEERDVHGPRRGHSYVYRRAGEPCRVCGTRVRTRELQGRNLYWCAKCQPRFRSRAVQ